MRPKISPVFSYVEGPKGNRVDIVSIPRYGGEVEDIKFSAISDKFPALLKDLFNQGPTDAFYLAKCWANVHFTVHDASSLFAVDSYYTSKEKFDISVSTKVCSFGADQVEKVEVRTRSLCPSVSLSPCISVSLSLCLSDPLYLCLIICSHNIQHSRSTPLTKSMVSTVSD